MKTKYHRLKQQNYKSASFSNVRLKIKLNYRRVNFEFLRNRARLILMTSV